MSVEAISLVLLPITSGCVDPKELELLVQELVDVFLRHLVESRNQREKWAFVNERHQELREMLAPDD